MLRGQWAEAEQEARQACEELQRFGLLDGVGFAHYAIGEVRLRMGDLDGAAEAFDRAYEFGHDAQPGLALLQLARGEVDDARRSIERALARDRRRAGSGRTRRRAVACCRRRSTSPLRAATCEPARDAVEELESIAADYERPLFQAGALTARGELLLGEDRPSEASPSWASRGGCGRHDLPYESARARLRYAEALAAEGDEATARRDLRAARAVFERLGATLDLQRVDALLGEESGRPRRPAERVTKTFMFTDIVTSTDLVGLIGDEAWSELLSWHDRELRSAFASHRGEEVKHTGDGFFVAFDKAADAIECAVDIQRRLTRHRREHGFAPSVRIGLHAGGGDAGWPRLQRPGRARRGARRRARPQAGDPRLRRASCEQAGPTRFRPSEPRSLTLKGVREPVEVRAVDWR